ncbi:hydrogen peroxide-inducible genes activator [Motiliproteus sp. SC1-56]|uniref:hydrogen peroxide-inducible genes activator n=1 Tax=Motiliproteus sp. SC1-56 TaxID=2799565 RepID=UPI001A8EDF92|nr:hydrogen peroxide-inducible genes activator [Motiliproteus sp. SC1-56]
MTLTELRYIVSLAQERHFGRAAERCCVSQPTLSVAVKKLEEELGVPLFERSKSSVQPTPVGERIVSQAQKVLEEVQGISELAHAGRDQLKATLKIGAIYTVGPYLYPHLVPAIRDLAREMPLYLEENLTEVLREKLHRGELDAIVIALPFEEADVLVRPLFDEPFVMLLPSGHEWDGQATVDPQDLHQTRLLMLGEGHCFRDQVVETCPGLQRRESGALITEGGSLETIRHMVAGGLGASVIPQSAAVGLQESPELHLKAFDPVPSRTLALAWRASFPRPKAIEVLLQSILQCREPFLDGRP